MKLTPNIFFTKIPPTINMNIKSELFSVNEFTFIVSVILSAQATDKKVNEITPSLFKVADTPLKMVKLGEEKLKTYINQISFFNNKAKNIISLSKKLLEMDSIIPKNRDELVKLPGIGQKTANVVTNVLWGEPNIGVDTHVFRLSHRFNWVDELDNTPEKVEKKLLSIIPKKYHYITNHVMVLHGRYVCKALKPKCDKCPVIKWCEYSKITI